MLTEKYGNPYEVVEKFDVRFAPKDDKDKMYQVRSENCKYYSTWRTDKGNIELVIDHDRITKSFVRLTYFDKINK